MAVACSKPFENLEIGENGDIFTCCPAYINYKKIGNIFDEKNGSLDDIWYSKEVTEIRQAVIDGSYSCCNLDVCRSKTVEEDENFTLRPPLPKFFTFSYDRECNIRCVTCRDCKIRNTDEQKEFLDKKAEQILIPLMQNAKTLMISGSGECFASEHTRKLIKTLTSKYLNLKFKLMTNGLLFNEKNIEILGLKGRINDVCFSIHSLREETYNKIMQGSELSVVLQNIKWAKSLQDKQEIGFVKMNCVISSYNFDEIPDFIRFAQDLNIHVSFSMYYKWGTALDEEYDELTVWQKQNPRYDEFVEVLKTVSKMPCQNYDMPPLFRQILEKLED